MVRTIVPLKWNDELDDILSQLFLAQSVCGHLGPKAEDAIVHLNNAARKCRDIRDQFEKKVSKTVLTKFKKINKKRKALKKLSKKPALKKPARAK